MSKYTEAEVLAFHDMPEVGGTLADRARASLVVSICLGCASITVAPDPVSRDAYAREADQWDCCVDAPTIVYR